MPKRESIGIRRDKEPEEMGITSCRVHVEVLARGV